MALRRHRLPRFWLAFTLGPVLALVGLVYWWERQLPARIQQAADAGRLEDCLRYGDQLSALSWLPGGVPQEQGRCRRQRAEQLWQAQRWREALQMQRQLVQSPAAGPADRQRLKQWQESLQQQAISLFRGGDLEAALRRLEPLGSSSAGGLADELRQIWERNRLQLQRAERLSRQARWWEALDALNRIDHPWWRQRSAAVRARVQKGVDSLDAEHKEHDGHGALPHSVDTARLDALVRRRIAAGMEEWQAFEQSCRELGGKVVEAGPDSACQR